MSKIELKGKGPAGYQYDVTVDGVPVQATRVVATIQPGGYAVLQITAIADAIDVEAERGTIQYVDMNGLPLGEPVRIE